MPTGIPKDNSLSKLNQQLEDEANVYYDWIEAPPSEKQLMLADPDFKVPEAPPELQVLLDFEKWGALPWDGGLFDQPDILMGQLTILMSVREDVRITYADIAAQKPPQESTNATTNPSNRR